jgi:hypothetical protein
MEHDARYTPPLGGSRCERTCLGGSSSIIFGLCHFGNLAHIAIAFLPTTLFHHAHPLQEQVL